MATVRITKELIQDIHRETAEIGRKVHEATIAILNPILDPTIKNEVYVAAVSKVWGDTMHLRNIVPKSWLKIVHHVDVKFAGCLQKEVRISMETLIPPDNAAYTYVETTLLPEDVPRHFYAFKEFFDAEGAHTQKFMDLSRKIEAFLSSCKSLNAALHQYPDIALYVPQKYKDKVAEIVVREKKEKTTHHATDTLTAEDRELITAAGVIGALYESPQK